MVPCTNAALKTSPLSIRAVVKVRFFHLIFVFISTFLFLFAFIASASWAPVLPLPDADPCPVKAVVFLLCGASWSPKSHFYFSNIDFMGFFVLSDVFHRKRSSQIPIFRLADAPVSAEERKRRARETVLTVDKLIQPNPNTKPLKVGPGPKSKPHKKRKAPTGSDAAKSDVRLDNIT